MTRLPDPGGFAPTAPPTRSLAARFAAPLRWRGLARIRSLAGLVLAAGAFAVAATANSGGYRYGVSDQAFYTAAVLKDQNPSLFPRDTALLAAESALMWSDEIVAGLSRLLRVDLPPLYLALYAATLALLFAAAVRFSRTAGMSWWAVAAFIALLTLRHRIARTGANSLEGYMHPRMLAFAIGVYALSEAMATRYGRALALVAVAACWHPTTALWFGLVVGISLFGGPRRWRAAAAAMAVAAAAAAIWAITDGPLAGRLIRMDPAWLSVLDEKDYLFPHEWPVDAWLLNLAYPILVYAIYRRRRARGLLAPGEPAVVAGLITLAAIFLAVVPFTMLRIALAVQMQATRVFWVLDLAMAAYLGWWLMDDRFALRAIGRRAVLLVLVAGSIVRGAYLLSLDRRLVAMDYPRTPWIEAMHWLKRQPTDWYVLADPIHTWRYGVSVRIAAEKDTLVERGKDTALAMYDRDVAVAVADRLWAVRDFNRTSTADFRTIAARYGIDVLVVEHTQALELPVLYRNSEFVIYRVK